MYYHMMLALDIIDECASGQWARTGFAESDSLCVCEKVVKVCVRMFARDGWCCCCEGRCTQLRSNLKSSADSHSQYLVPI